MATSYLPLRRSIQLRKPFLVDLPLALLLFAFVDVVEVRVALVAVTRLLFGLVLAASNLRCALSARLASTSCRRSSFFRAIASARRDLSRSRRAVIAAL